MPIEQMQHEPGCQCGSEPSTGPAPRDVDDLWQPAVAIAGSVRGALQPPPTVAVLMPEVGLRLTFNASCADTMVKNLRLGNDKASQASAAGEHVQRPIALPKRPPAAP